MREARLLELIKQRLATSRDAPDPRSRILEGIEGPVSAAFREVLEQPTRAASVLIALIDRPSGPTMLFTERAAHLKNHAGQISFPGGRIAPGETAIAAALREAAEEVSLEPQAVAVLGCLDVHWVITGFVVTPVVGWVSVPFEPRPDPLEVASVFEVPLDFLLDPANTTTVHRERLGTRFRSYELQFGGHRIWGATAAMLRAFRDKISDEKTV
jgi:8-oxo-dGTP pyrophosphatase MutT (NUDIX family)